jgi:putative phosphonate metabolism protein
MTSFRRHAVYWAPPAGSPLARFGAAWLGWDAAAGRRVPHPDLPGLPLPVAEITAAPRKYGFHGTLKPPFRLAEGADAGALDRAAQVLAGRMPAFEAPRLRLARIGGFVALVPSGGCPPLAELAARAVTELDALRAPPGEAELAKRRSPGLTARQEALTARWGYPYVMDEFRFHLTLTGPLAPKDADRVIAALAGPTAPFCRKPLPVTELCLFGEDEAGRFHLARRYALTG